MKKRTKLLFIAFVMLIPYVGLADEGMWLVNLIAKYNIEKMNDLGCELTADQIYSINTASLKDAIVALDFGSCTGEFVSNQGLLFTNHHCAYDNIHKLSTAENNYLDNGFWAYKMEDEIPINGKTASILVRVEDVSDRIKSDIEREKATGKFNSFTMRRIYNTLEREEGAKSGLETSVSSLFKGNRYFIFYYKVFRDVRLVGAPPSSIGAFGGDTDNWTWPQHKGDFAIYRVYANENGEPADFSPNNKPYKPASHLSISLKGINDGDFTMIMGYPYATNRYVSSFGLEEKMNVSNPAIIAVRSQKLAIMQEAMRASDDLRIKYASKFFGSSNLYKYTVGESKYLKQYNVLALKQDKEAELVKWINESSSRIERYGEVLPKLKELYSATTDFQNTDRYYQEALINGSDMLRFALRGKGMHSALLKDNSASRTMETMSSAAIEHFKDYDLETDKLMFAAAIKNFYENVNPDHISKEFKALVAKFKGDYSKVTEYVYKNSFFATSQKLIAFMEKPSLKGLQNDPLFVLTNSSLDIIYDLRHKNEAAETEIRNNERLLLAAIMEMKGEETLYPDASSTMRLTYGTVGGFTPRDGVLYKHYTTHAGYLAKEDATDYEFVVDPKFKSLLKEGDFGRYADSNGNLRMGFLSNNDITGGNSGSPVLNARGEMVGLGYDGNWESMAGDIYFHPDFNKTVCVDIRYVLFVIDKFAKAQNIMNELSIVE
ncbi:MAG: S46 family peptidase [Bacteroidales bacterium]|nr:S46 family peptidase [Bacteroidales bacterium]MBN2750525.1 S46 family peptidase [Bacteroidales bacterium]